jgi:hypothetical protein
MGATGFAAGLLVLLLGVDHWPHAERQQKPTLARHLPR